MSAAELRRDLRRFSLWALAGSVPFWVAGFAFGRIPGVAAHLPWTALGALVPAAVAVALSRTPSARGLLRAQLRPSGRLGWWLIAAACGLAPTLLDAARHGPWTPPGVLTAAGLFALYAVGALGEELGWTGFAQPRLLRLTNSVPATAALLGGYWMVWHFVPFLTTGRPLAWVLAQSVQVLLSRAVLVGLTTASGGGVWLAVWTHALGNLAWSLSPEQGALYDPVVADLILLPLAAAALWAGVRRWPAA